MSGRTTRLVSYNVRYAQLDVGAEAWTERRDGVAAFLDRADPDVVCLQEVWQDQLADLRERLPGHEWVAVRRDDAEHTPIGYRPDRFEVVDSGAFSLSETPEDLAAYDWGATIPRVTTRARLRERDGDDATEFEVVSTHFDHASDEARRRSADLLADRFGDADLPTVVAGDFNCPPGSDPYKTLLDAGFRDTRAHAEEVAGPEATFNDFDAPQPGERIDHVFVAGRFDVERFRVLDDHDDRGRYPSDHFPVVVDLEPA